MRTIILSLLFFVILLKSTVAQILPLTTEPDGGNKKATLSEQIGIVQVAVSYNRPGVKGREGKIWNTTVAHYGFADQGHGTSYAAPWRAGANENTTITFSHPVTIDGKILAAGKYGFFIALGEEESILVFSKINNSWGSFYYDSTFDALRVAIKNERLQQSVEWLRFDFTEQTDSSTVLALSWEKKRFPFRIEANTKKLQIEAFKNDLRTTRPPSDFIQAANYCIRHNIELEQALAWMDRAISFRIMGEKNFQTLSTKAAVLNKMNRTEEAKKIMEEAIPFGTMQEVHFYGRTLLQQKLQKEALIIFQRNYEKFPNQFTTNIGLARAFSATGDYKKAIPFMKAALPQSPDETNRKRVEEMIKKLEAGSDVN